MSIAKIRGLSKFGVVTDVDPYDLPPEAFSLAINARFHDGRILRAPVFRQVASLPQSSPRFTAASFPTSGRDLLVCGFLNGRIYAYSSGLWTNLSVPAYADASAELPYTHTHLADVFYVNRGDRAPWALKASDTTFNTLANWPASTTAKLLRSCGAALVALNVTEVGVNYPTMIRTSSFPQAGAVPVSWDYTNVATNSTRDILAEMEGPIVDAQNLRNDLFIYGVNETWVMSFDPGQFVFDKRKVFDKAGAINANCVVEVDGLHFVFGTNDIWKHDGNSKVSIADKRVRDFIFRSINMAKANRCFVAHDANRKELKFYFVSGDRKTAFLGAEGCNRSAVYNYGDDNWSFDDEPFVFYAYPANLDAALTYATVTSTYDTIGGTYLDQEDTFKRTLVVVGDVNAGYGLSASLYAFDPHGPGSTVSFPVDTNATRPVYLERDGIDLDSLGLDLRGYKLLRSIYPQGRLDPEAAPMEFIFGAADYFNQATTLAPSQTYDGSTLYKLDYNMAGRYLSMQMKFSDYRFFTLSGIDIELVVTGAR